MAEETMHHPSHHKDSEANPTYLLAFSLILVGALISASIYFSVTALNDTLMAKNFAITITAPVTVNASIPAAVAAIVNPTPSPSPSPAPTPAAAPGCGAPSAAPGAPATIANIDITGRPVEGNPNAKVTIVEFSEYLCPFSKRVQPTVAQIMKDYNGTVKHVYMHYFIHGEPPKKPAVAVECAGDQGKFWEYSALLFEDQKVDVDSLKAKAARLNLNAARFSTCLDSPAKLAEVERQHALGQQNRVGGTPSFFINGRMIVGSQPYDSFKTLIDAELAK